MLELEEALSRILAALPAPTTESVPLTEASGRFLAGRVTASIDLPAFNNSAVDGYAVRAADVVAARADAPVGLRLQGRAIAGGVFAEELRRGATVRLFTGAPMPRGADAVVMQEDTRRGPTEAQEILILDSVTAGENVRRQGDDVQRGAVLGEPGQRLRVGRLSLLAASGLSALTVARRPRVALLATGSELKEPGVPLRLGEIYESNRIGLAALVAQAGGTPEILPIVPDDPAATRAALAQAFGASDMVVTSGGVSVGEMDFVKSAFGQLGGTLDFWKVAIKPGRPFVFGRLERKFLFGLPGNPVSALVTFALLVRPALLRWQGAREVALPAYRGVLGEALANPGPRRHFLRVRTDGAGGVYSAGAQASHVLSSLAQASGLVDVPPQTALAAGTTVKVWCWD